MIVSAHAGSARAAMSDKQQTTSRLGRRRQINIMCPDWETHVGSFGRRMVAIGQGPRKLIFRQNRVRSCFMPPCAGTRSIRFSCAPQQLRRAMRGSDRPERNFCESPGAAAAAQFFRKNRYPQPFQPHLCRTSTNGELCCQGYRIIKTNADKATMQ